MSRLAPAPETRKPPEQEAAATQYPGWLGAEVEGRSVGFWVGVGLLIAAITLGFGGWWTFGLDRGMGGEPIAGQAMEGMGGVDLDVDAPRLPPVSGFYAGETVTFVHPEVSDPAVADMLSEMMGSSVVVVPGLAEVGRQLVGTVVVFTNGVEPTETPPGPLGFQADVFDSAPGDDDYTPLRQVVLATWVDPQRAEVLRSMEDVQGAVDAGLLDLEDTEAVVNAPFLTWPGGER